MQIDTKRLVHWIGKIDEPNLIRVGERIVALAKEAPKKEIFLLVTSTGGSAGAGFCFYDIIRRLKPTPNLVTIGSGDVSSMGIIVWLTGKKRLLTPNTAMFFHEARRNMSSGSYTETELGGTARNLEIDANLYTAIVAENSRGQLTANEVRTFLKSERTFLPNEVVKLGLAHSIL